MNRQCACPVTRCLCAQGQETPQTLSDLRTKTSVSPLDVDLETLAMVGTQLAEALITTSNNGALISGRGGYARAQPIHADWTVSGARVALRYAPQAPLRFGRSAENASMRLPSSVFALNSAGQIRHRVQVFGAFDRRVVEALPPQSHWPQAPVPAQSEQAKGDVVSLCAVRAARRGWSEAGAGAHLNDLISDGGVIRHQCLPHMGAARAWQIAPGYLESFLNFLAERRISFTRVVPCEGMLQANAGPVDAVRHAGNLCVALAENHLFSYDRSQVDTVWVTACGAHWQIELYSRSGKAIAVLASDYRADEVQWRRFLSCLPQKRRA